MDASDELSCRTLYWHEGGQDAYTQELPPKPYKQAAGKSLPVLISANIQNVLELKELEGYWQTKVIFTLLWFDQLLLMQNLKHDEGLNLLADEERQTIWFPEIIFGNNDEVLRMVLDEKASIIVKRTVMDFRIISQILLVLNYSMAMKILFNIVEHIP